MTTLTDQSANGRLVKNGTGGAIAAGSWAHDAQGAYLVGLGTAHTDTVGRLRVAFYDAATYLPVWEDFSVLAAAVYDVIFGTVAPSTHTAAAVAALVAADARLANLDATVSSRSTYAGGDTAGTTTLLARLTAGRATNLDNLDAAISTRSTYAGADTAGTGTLLTLLTPGRATNLDNLDAAVSTRLAAAGYTAPPTAAAIDTQLSGTHGAGAWDAAGGGGSVTVAGYAAGQDPATLLDARLDAIDAAVAGLPAAGAAMTLTAGERAAVAAALLDLADGVETGETLRQLCRRLRAFSAGLATTDVATGVDTFLRKDGATPAFTVTHDADGNRTASTDGTL